MTQTPPRTGAVPTRLGAVLTLAMALPMLVLYAVGILGPAIVADTGIGNGLLGALTATCFAVAAVFSLAAAQVIEAIGERRSLLALFALVACSFALVAVSGGYGGLLLGIALCGVAQALANPATNKLIARLVPEHRRGVVVGVKQSGVQVSALFAGTVLAAVAAWLGWRWAAAVPVVLAVLCLGVTLLVVPEDDRPPVRPAWTTPTRPASALRVLMVFQFFLGCCLAALTTFLPVFAIGELGVGVEHAALMIAGFGVVGVIARVLWGRIADRRRTRLTTLMTLLAALAAVGALSLSISPVVGPAAAWLGALVLGATAVPGNALSMLAVIQERRFGAVPTASAMVSAAFFAGFAVAPPLFGAAADRVGSLGALWGLLVAAAVAAAVAAHLVGRRLSGPGS